MERERQEEHEGAKRGVSLEVDVQVVAAALQVRARPVAVPGLWYERGILLPSRPHLPTVQNDPLQNEDGEEAGSHDELWQGEIALFQTHKETLISFNV